MGNILQHSNGVQNGTRPPDGSNRRNGDAPYRTPQFKLTTLDELLARPDADYLIDEFLVEGTTAAITGDSEAFKTFAALDMGLCIACGIPWQGREVKQGAVVYIVAEGAWALKVRVRAWLQVRGMTKIPRDFYMFESAIPVLDKPTMAAFTSFIAEKSPRFVVLDTLSTCSEGMNENANHEMAAFVAGMTAISRATGATVTAIHHHGKNGQTRGATSLKNNVDTLIVFERSMPEESRITRVSCDKHRGAKFEEFALHGEVIELPTRDRMGRALTSLVLRRCDLPESAKTEKHANAQRSDQLDEKLLQIFDGISAEFGGVKAGTWCAAATEQLGFSSATFFRHLNRLKGQSDKKGRTFTAQIEHIGQHQGSDLYRRVNATLTTLTTFNESCESAPSNAASSTLTTLTIPLGSESCESESSRGAKTKTKRKSLATSRAEVIQ